MKRWSLVEFSVAHPGTTDILSSPGFGHLQGAFIALPASSGELTHLLSKSSDHLAARRTGQRGVCQPSACAGGHF
jgi:hypothetical protein